MIPKIKHNRRYSKRVDKEDEEDTQVQGAVTSRTARN
jgi:hypothetical protein